MTHTFIIRHIVGGKFLRFSVSVIAILCFVLPLIYGEYLYAFLFWVYISLGLLITVFSFDAIDIDFQKKIYYNYLSVCGIKFSVNPLILPEINYLLIKDTRLDLRPNGEQYAPSHYYEAALVCKDNFKIVLTYSDNRNEIINFIDKIQKIVNCQIKDITKEQLFKK